MGDGLVSILGLEKGGIDVGEEEGFILRRGEELGTKELVCKVNRGGSGGKRGRLMEIQSVFGKKMGQFSQIVKIRGIG